MKEVMVNQLITMEELKEMSDDCYVLFNSNRLYYLMSEYGRLNHVEDSSHRTECLNILFNWQRDLEILSFYGYFPERSLYHSIKVSDAKTLLKPWLDKGKMIPFNTLRRCENCSYNMEDLRKRYLSDVEHQKLKRVRKK